MTRTERRRLRVLFVSEQSGCDCAPAVYLLSDSVLVVHKHGCTLLTREATRT